LAARFSETDECNRQNQEEKWVASKTESYEFFTDYLEDIDLCPSIDDGTTK
jgi:hypothetical protein